MSNNLLSWIGNADLGGPEGKRGKGPIAAAIDENNYDEIDLISNWPKSKKEIKRYDKWIKEQTTASVKIHFKSLKNGPNSLDEVYHAAVDVVREVVDRYTEHPDLTYQISAGTPVMAAVWIVLSQVPSFKSKLVASSTNEGVLPLNVPFSIYTDFIPEMVKESDFNEQAKKLIQHVPTSNKDFKGIIGNSLKIEQAKSKAFEASLYDACPVLIEGESGTGKELFAKAIHSSGIGSSKRKNKNLYTINCGAIPEDLIESELFGYVEGAFTGGKKGGRKGAFEKADGGMLFLDEVGELSAAAQVKLLRAIEYGEIQKVGSDESIEVDVRVIAATNRTLANEVRRGNFREDLYYRLAQAPILVPPLRDRSGDVSLLIDYFMEEYNKSSFEDKETEYKKLSRHAKKELERHSWPGNVRELRNMMKRLFIFYTPQTIGVENIREAMFPTLRSEEVNILEKPLGNGFSLDETLDFVEAHFLKRALDEAPNNKAAAGRLLGLPSNSNFYSKLDKHNITRGDKRK